MKASITIAKKAYRQRGILKESRVRSTLQTEFYIKYNRKSCKDLIRETTKSDLHFKRPFYLLDGKRHDWKA